MPELPEVDTVRRSLEPHIAGRRCRAVTLLRPDIVDGPPAGRGLLEGAEISAIRRRGKQLALVAKDGRVLVVHLGMTGRLIWNGAHDSSPHVHALWRFDGGGTMRFVDPRRFGGLTPLRDVGALERRWAALGPDALTIGPEDL
ncbi:MAG: DNA-formamidopyrimidine glycosylase, partial [Phycisphaerae bacterium]|nr:DNA-formamidopyrimidine glycosylase [Phycisphaerae bacterium]